MVTQRSLADLRGSNGHGLGNVEGDGGVVSDSFVVQSGAICLCETYSARYTNKLILKTQIHIHTHTHTHTHSMLTPHTQIRACMHLLLSGPLFLPTVPLG